MVVDDVIDHTGFGLFQVFVMVLAGILWVSVVYVTLYHWNLEHNSIYISKLYIISK